MHVRAEETRSKGRKNTFFYNINPGNHVVDVKVDVKVDEPNDGSTVRLTSF